MHQGSQCRTRCTKAAQCRARYTNAVAGPGRPGQFAQQALPEQAHLASCYSKYIIWPVVCRLHDQCSCQARHCTGGSAGGIEAAARCGRGRCPSRQWPEHAHWPRSCCHMFKVRVLCCNASSKWAVSGRGSQVQRNDHGSDHSWLAHATSSSYRFPPIPIIPHSSQIFLSFVFSLFPPSDLASVQGSFEGVESASHTGWMSHAPPSQEKRGCGAGALTLAISEGPALHDCCIVLITAGAKS